MDIKELQSFIRTLPMDNDTVKTVESVKKSVEGILAIEEREFKREKKEYAEEQKDTKRKARDRKRKKADKKPGMLTQILGNKSEQKRAGNDLTNLLLAGGLLAGGATLAWNYKDEITDYVQNTMLPMIQTAVGDAVTALGGELVAWGEQQMKNMARGVGQAIEASPVVSAGRNLQESVQLMFAGHGVTKGGTVFTLQDLTDYRDRMSMMGVEAPGPVREAMNNVQQRLMIDKSLNDQIARTQERIDALTSGNGINKPTFGGELKKIQQEVADLRHNREQNRKIMANEWAKLMYSDADLQRNQRKDGRRDDKGYIHRQTGGTIDQDKKKGDKTDERLFSTTGFMEGAKRPSKEQRLQTGGLVLFKGHGDVPPGSGIAPGTDGPGTDIQGKYKPTAEQHFVEQVAKKTVLLAQRENVPISYQAPTGYYKSASHPKSNWSLANGIRRKGGSALELHFDAWGTQNGQYMEGARGILKGGQGALSKIEKSVENKFGVHPASGKGWGTLMLELDSLKYARTRVDSYTRMLVDSVKNAGAKGNAPATVKPGTTGNTTPQQQKPQVQPKTESFNPLGGLMDGLNSIMSGLGAFGQGFKDGWTSNFKNPFANAEKHQNGGRVGGKGSSLTQRFSKAQSSHNVGAGNTTVRPVVVVKRRAQAPIVSGGGGSAPAPSSRGLNMLELKQAIHRQVNASGI